jgi:hypothetical protein
MHGAKIKIKKNKKIEPLPMETNWSVKVVQEFFRN